MRVDKVLNNFKSNWKSGLTVSLVSIPLSVSLAVASQTSPVVGIVTAIWAGLITSIFGGSNYNIVGPTGALSGILASFAISNGADKIPMLAIAAGVFILIAYILKLEKYLNFVPASTVHGFTLGVAFIIGLNQLNFALGLSGLKVHEKFIENFFESISHLNIASPSAFLVFLIFLLGLFTFKKYMPKIPGAIILAPVGILIGYLSVNNNIPLKLITLGEKYQNIDSTLYIEPKLFIDSSLIVPALTVALVAILETMISAKIADGMTKTKHNKRKEMLGLGLANLGSGIMGGIPATAALARTSLNIKTGATSRLSAAINSLGIIIISFLFLAYFKFIPLAVIAAILVFVAIRMIEAKHFVHMYKIDKKSFVISMLVAVVTIYEDPIVGILFGTAIALLLFVEKLSKGQFELVINDENKKIIDKISGDTLEQIKHDSNTLVYSIKGQLAYINGQAHISRFENKLNGSENIILRFRELYFIDLDGIDALEEIGELLDGQNKNVYITGINPLIEKMLHESHFYQNLKAKGHIFNKTTDALKFLGYKI